MWFGVREIVADGHTQSTVEALAANGPDRALLEAVQAVQLRPDILRNRIALARTLSIAGGADSFKAAVKVLNEALDWSPRDPVLRRERGLLLTTIAQSSHGGADIDAALASWEQQAHDDPNNADTLVELGFAQVTANRMGDAEKTWTRAAELQPRSAAALLDLVKLYLSDKRLTQARAAVDEAGRRAAGDPAVTQAESAVQAAGG